ncbi:MAG: hypothetical protein JRE23_16945 [Deltaproteobacteria bacterium]|nr:hypothetical protein [Deltaproteobacteria bacterium]
METVVIKDGNGDPAHWAVSGKGTKEDPYLPIQDVNVQDQTTRPLFLPFTKDTGVVTGLTVEPTAGVTRVLNVVSSAGWSVTDGIGVFSGDDSGSFFFGTIIAVDAGGANELTVDSPIDYAFPTATTGVVQLSYDMNVDGSATPQIFQVRGADAFNVDVTRILITILTEGAVDFNGFGDASTALPNGLVCRRVNGVIENLWNVKRNIGFANIAYDLTRYAKLNPQDVDGLVMRLTFAGPSKMGVAVRLKGANDMLQLINQDVLTLLGPYGIVSMTAMAEGHVVQP